MRPLLRHTLFLLLMVALLPSATRLSAQIPGGQTGFNPALLQLFGEHKAFSGRLDLRTIDPAGKDLVKSPMDFAMLDGKIRVQVDITQITSASMDADSLALFKKAGMDQVISIIRPDQGKSQVIFPNAKAMASEPLAEGDAAAFLDKYQVTAKETGKEKVGSHDCVRKDVTVTSNRGKKIQGTVWYAQDLKGFPVKIKLPEGGTTVDMTFVEVKLSKPDSAQFEAPAGTAQYASVEKLLQERVFQALGK